MGEQLNTTVPMVNLTLVVFFIFLGVGTLMWGPLTDRFGRKPIIMIGLLLFIVSSIACACSINIYQLIGARIFQAIGSGAAIAGSLAIIKDFFKSKLREKALAMVGILMGVVPIVAPVLGAQMLKIMSWRGLFVMPACIGILTFCFSLFYKETNKALSNRNLVRTWMRLFAVLQNSNFRRLAILFDVFAMSVMAFVGIAAVTYVKHFGVSEEEFSLFFAANAVLLVVGGPLYLVLTRRIKPIHILTSCFVLMVISGILMTTLANLSPFLFAGSMAFASLATALSRPPSNSLILEQLEGDTGSASSIIISLYTLLGSIGLFFISQDWENRIVILGLVHLSIGIGGLFLWIFSKSKCKFPSHFM
jgi:DHA1 family bicyclomycin/chloramphenicol resistance-like MFS transporter